MGRSSFALGGVILLFVAGIVGFVALTAGSLLKSTPLMATTADQFLAKLAKGDDSGARQHLASSYSESLNNEAFREFVLDNDLRSVTGSNWLTKQSTSDSGLLVGDVFRSEGRPLSVRFELTLQESDWKINDIEIDGVGAELTPPSVAATPKVNESAIPPEIESTLSASSPPGDTVSKNPKVMNHDKPISSLVAVLTIRDIPSDEEAKQIVQDWTHEFCKGVSKRSFSSFHSRFADEFRDKFTLAKFTKVFQEFIDRRIDLGWVNGVEPILDRRPALTSEGVLELAGHYPADPRVNFSYSFARKQQDWKPVSINLEIPTEGSETGIPEIEELNRLVKDNTSNFGLAVKTRDFGGFYHQTYSRFQDKFTLQQFRDYFGSFVANEVTLDWIDGIDPIFDVSPSINAKGFLHLEGHFPADPKVIFKYGFIREDASWRVSAINLAIPSENKDQFEASSRE